MNLYRNMISLLEQIKNFEHNSLTVHDIEKLLYAGENINQTDENGNTLLIDAINYANNDSIELLLKFGIDPNITNNDGMSPLLFAIKNENIFIIELLLKYNIIYKFIEESLIYSVKNNKLEISQILLNHIHNKNN